MNANATSSEPRIGKQIVLPWSKASESVDAAIVPSASMSAPLISPRITS